MGRVSRRPWPRTTDCRVMHPLATQSPTLFGGLSVLLRTGHAGDPRDIGPCRLGPEQRSDFRAPMDAADGDGRSAAIGHGPDTRRCLAALACETLERSATGRVETRHLLREMTERDIAVLGHQILD